MVVCGALVYGVDNGDGVGEELFECCVFPGVVVSLLWWWQCGVNVVVDLFVWGAVEGVGDIVELECGGEVVVLCSALGDVLDANGFFSLSVLDCSKGILWKGRE